jgi:hypothetical protein
MMVLFALTFEEALAYEPTLQTSTVFTLEEPPLIPSGERIPTSSGWKPEARSEFRSARPERSWKCHRRSQIGGLRI